MKRVNEVLCVLIILCSALLMGYVHDRRTVQQQDEQEIASVFSFILNGAKSAFLWIVDKEAYNAGKDAVTEGFNAFHYDTPNDRKIREMKQRMAEASDIPPEVLEALDDATSYMLWVQHEEIEDMKRTTLRERLSEDKKACASEYGLMRSNIAIACHIFLSSNMEEEELWDQCISDDSGATSYYLDGWGFHGEFGSCWQEAIEDCKRQQQYFKMTHVKGICR